MRQRKAKDLDTRMENCSSLLVEDPSPASWSERFGDGDLYVEIGCGKGDFIIKKSKDDPEGSYVAIEGQETVILRALEKAMEEERDNLVFYNGFVHDMADLFSEDQLAGVYLNFSDPWPKARHRKRRLTYRKRLLEYAEAVRPGGFIEFKTDNEGLFDFTIGEINEAGLEITEITRDLHSSRYGSRLTMTEYEKKFHGRGKNINYVRVRV